MGISRRELFRHGAVVAAAGMTGAAAASLLVSGPAGAAPAAPTGVQEPRYLGYLPADLAKPYAKYMQSCTRPMQAQVLRAYNSDATPAARIPAFADLPTEFNRPGHSAVENGYGVLADGVTVWAAALTTMPRVTAAMWDWWFGWHSSESARYRLWHPDAHAYASIAQDRSTTPGLTDRQRYIGNTSYVDEFIGGQLEQLAITFLDPVAAGFHTSPTTTVIYGRVGASELPVDLGYLAHQVRPVRGGSEMRSRFYLNIAGVRLLDPAAALAAHNRGDTTMLAQPLPFTVPYVRSLMEHCAREMNHLAHFLPELYADHHPRPGGRRAG